MRKRMVASTSAPAALGPEPVSLAPWAQAALVQPGRVTRGEELQGCRTSRYRMSSKAVGCGVARVWRAGRALYGEGISPLEAPDRQPWGQMHSLTSARLTGSSVRTLGSQDTPGHWSEATRGPPAALGSGG